MIGHINVTKTAMFMRSRLFTLSNKTPTIGWQITPPTRVIVTYCKARSWEKLLSVSYTHLTLPTKA